MAELAFIVHGGAWEIPEALHDTCKTGVKRALEKGWAILLAGGSALDACEHAIVELENDPVFDAGIGSHLNRDGKAQLDAIVMDGRTLKSGAVACVEHLSNPIQVARHILHHSEHMLLTGYGAERFAVEHGFELCDPSLFCIPQETRRWREVQPGSLSMGTVGAVAMDGQGNLASGTSTGGTFFKHPGRVGDSPLVGCGCYADNESAAVSATGHGESIMKTVLSREVSALVSSGLTAQDACDRALATLNRRTSGKAGVIAVDRLGRPGAAFSTPNMVYASISSREPVAVVQI